MIDTNELPIESTSLINSADEIQTLIYELTRYYGICDRFCVEQLEITAAQGYILLAMPDQDSITMNDLSARMKLANSTMTRTVDPLCIKELLVRESDSEDRRIVRVRLTERGREVSRDLKEAFQQVFIRVLEDIPEKDIEKISQSLLTLNRSVGKAIKECCGSDFP